jgi:predicted YcjX-like family ATPase
MRKLISTFRPSAGKDGSSAKTLRIGVTGLSRAGKTIFLTSLIHNLLEGGADSLPELKECGLIFYGKPLPPANGVKLFPYKEHINSLRAPQPTWPRPTLEPSAYRILVDAGHTGSKRTTFVLELFDYPGEMLLDVPLHMKQWIDWSDYVLGRWADRCTDDNLRSLDKTWQDTVRFALTTTESLGATDRVEMIGRAWQHLCQGAQACGVLLSPVFPLLMPRPSSDDRHGLFGPLTREAADQHPDIVRLMSNHYDDYVKSIVDPFVRQLSQCSQQIVLVDVLAILENDRKSKKRNEVREELRDVIECMNYVDHHSLVDNAIDKTLALFNRSWRIRRVIFCATKADQVRKDCHRRLAALLEQLVERSAKYLELRGHCPRYGYCAAVKATVEIGLRHNDGTVESALKGVCLNVSESQEKKYRAQDIPETWPSQDRDWPDFRFVKFAPPRIPDGDGLLPSLGLDSIIRQFLEDIV